MTSYTEITIKQVDSHGEEIKASVRVEGFEHDIWTMKGLLQAVLLANTYSIETIKEIFKE